MKNRTFTSKIGGITVSMTIRDHEEVHGIQIPESEANESGISLIVNKHYLFRCRCLGSVRALDLARTYVWKYLFNEAGLTYGEDSTTELTKIATNFSCRCEDDGFGWLWGVSFEIIPYAAAMNDPDSPFFYTFAAGVYSRESLWDINAVPLLLQYQYPVDHPQYPLEIITSNATIQKDVALFTFTLNLIKEMKYPEAAAGFISYVNEFAWKGFPPRMVKITNISIRGQYTSDTRDDNKKHYYICTFEFQVNDDGWDQVVAITDYSGEHPGDVSFDGSLQTGLTYPAGRNAEVFPSFDFHRLWPDTDNTTFQNRIAEEFPIPT